MKNCFVFAVCGDSEHIDTLNYSLRALKKFTTLPIIVVTEFSRNAGTIEHDNIINYSAPTHFNHHQASIYLKTSLHRILPMGTDYCYLDSDVVAVCEEAAQVFNHQYNIITFAPDHCTMNKFSPMAVNCGCIKRFRELVDHVEILREEYDRHYEMRKKVTEQLEREWKKRMEVLAQNRWRNFLFAVKLKLGYTKVWIDREYYLDVDKDCWVTKDGHELNYDYRLRDHVSDVLNLTWNEKGEYWQTPDGFNIYLSECNHLHTAIEKKFGIHINQNNWQHWNGGVFLFNEKSHSFMDTWHQYTMDILKDPYWKTRDQGTLIATVWKYGLQNANPLIKEFNFLADPYADGTRIVDEYAFTDNNGSTFLRPALIHLYHNFADVSSPFWQWTENRVKNGPIENTPGHVSN